MTGPRPELVEAVYDRQRMELIDTLATGDGQNWPDFWENPEQRRIGETMYGRQADELLASSWLAGVRQQIEADVRAKLADEIERMRADFAQETRLASAAFTAAQHRGLKAPRGMVGEMLAGWDDAMRTVERCMRLACDPGRDFIETDVSRDITSEKSLGYVSTLGRVAQEIARGAQDGAAE